MNSILELHLEVIGGIALLFAAVWVFARISGFGEYYNKMLYDEESDAYITIKEGEDNEDDIIHHVSI